MWELKVTLRPLYRNRIRATEMSLNADITACPQVRPGCSSWRDIPTCGIIFTILLLLHSWRYGLFSRPSIPLFLGFQTFVCSGREDVSPTPTPKPGGPGTSFNTCPACMTPLPAGHGQHSSFAQTIASYRVADKSLARPTSRFILFDSENISFDASLVIYVNSTNIPPIMIINRIY